MAIQVGPDRYIDTLAPGVFANHSCAPNAGVRNDRDLVALRDIPPGEEIRYDYSTTMDEKSFTMVCRCGAPGCRQVVTDFADLPAAIQDFYLSQRLVMSFIARRLHSTRAASTGEQAAADRGLKRGARTEPASSVTERGLQKKGLRINQSCAMQI